MKNHVISNIFKIFLCIVGTIIGAGFASGQEIMSFFVKYGINGAWGMVVSGVLFFVYIYVVLKKIRVCNINNFSEYFENIAGRRMSSIIELISYGFMLASFFVMVSGSGAVAKQMFDCQLAGTLFMAILCFVVFLKGVDGIVVVNSFMTPLIIFGILIVGIYTLVTSHIAVFGDGYNISITDNFLTSALVYVSYNTITLIGVLIPLKKHINSRKAVFYPALLSGVTLAAMGLILIFSLLAFKNQLNGVDVPMLYISEKIGTAVKYIYASVLYMAMITTAVSSGFAFLSFIKTYIPLNNRIISELMCIAAIPVSYMGFADLVNKLYGFFGFLGMFVLFMTLFEGIKNFFKKTLDKT